MNWDPYRLPDLHGRVYAITGATGGIGYFAAEQLASAGAEVVLASRSQAKLGQASDVIRQHAPGAVTHRIPLDLTSLASVASAADRLAAVPRLDGLFLNGGPMEFSRSALTEDGLPLMLGHGTGSELRRPLGFAMVGGLMLSQVLTLFTTPVVYLYLDRAHAWYMRRRGHLPGHATDAADRTREGGPPAGGTRDPMHGAPAD